MIPSARWSVLLILAALWLLPAEALAGPDAGPPDLAPDTGKPAVCGDGKCQASTEACDTCPKDCGTCNGCQARSKAKCPTCACEACVCMLDSYCCSKQWDSICAGQCKDKCGGCKLLDGSMQIDGLVDAAPESSPPPACGNGKCNPSNETCDTCPQDCGKCNGCKPMQNFGCPGCACEACVCKKDSYCCSVTWDTTCANLCKTCGGCGMGDMGPKEGGAPDVSIPTCGDGKCDPIVEYCDSCPKDCGQCDGCSMRLNKKCPGCKCESCVCTNDTYCCDSQWDSFCALGCKTRCTGCGTVDGGVFDMPKPPDQSADAPPQGICGDGKCDTMTEYCDTCPKDCGVCTGCQVRSKSNCPGCACEACVCKMDPDCCKFQWDHICVSECKKSCNGCASDAGVDFTAVDLTSKKDSSKTPDKTLPDITTPDITVDVKVPDAKPDLAQDSKPSDSPTPDTRPDKHIGDLPGPPSEQPINDLPGPPPDAPLVDQWVPSDIYIADRPAGKNGPGNPGGWECGCAATTPDASGLMMLLLPLLWVVTRRRMR